MRSLHVRIFEHGKHDAMTRVVASWTGRRRLAWLQPVHAVRPLHQGPAEVAGAVHAVDSLPKCLRDSCNKEAAVIAVKGDPEWIAKSPSPDFLFPYSEHKWVVARDRISRKSSIDVDTKDLAEQRVGILRKTVPDQRLRGNVERLPKHLFADSMRYATVAKADVDKAV